MRVTDIAAQILGQRLPAEGVESVFRTARTMAAEESMTTPVITAREEESLTSVVRRLTEHDLTHLPVVGDGEGIGLASRHDLLRVMLRQEEAGGPVESERRYSKRRSGPEAAPR